MSQNSRKDGPRPGDEGLRDRIRICADLAGGGNKLAQSAEIPRRTLENYLSGRSEPKAGALAAIANAAGVDGSWLLSGRGEARPTSLQRGPGEGFVSEAQFAAIPVYAVEASAGGGRLVPHENIVDLLAFKREWIHQELHAQPSDLYLLFVSGDSMEPTLRPGDLILVDKRDAPIRADGIYVLVIDGALLVKRLQTLLDGKVRIVSDNSAYPAMEANRGQMNWGVQDGGGVDVVGRVVWAGRRF